tara:strand:- start:728 stop:973 length:246 start_codon:yes stop_codon:yes gene_type:complete
MGWRHKELSSCIVGVGDVKYTLGASGEILSPEVSEDHIAFLSQHPDFGPTASKETKPEEPKAAPKAALKSKPKAKPAKKKK